MKTLAKAAALGLNIVLSLIVPIWLGNKIDEKLGCRPIGVLCGVAFGLGSCFKWLWEMNRE